jgi:hypothetical protein
MKLRLTYTIEYEVDETDSNGAYGTADPKEMLEIDLNNALNEPHLMLDYLVSIEGEIV